MVASAGRLPRLHHDANEPCCAAGFGLDFGLPPSRPLGAEAVALAGEVVRPGEACPGSFRWPVLPLAGSVAGRRLARFQRPLASTPSPRLMLLISIRRLTRPIPCRRPQRYPPVLRCGGRFIMIASANRSSPTSRMQVRSALIEVSIDGSEPPFNDAEINLPRQVAKVFKPRTRRCRAPEYVGQIVNAPPLTQDIEAGSHQADGKIS